MDRVLGALVVSICTLALTGCGGIQVGEESIVNRFLNTPQANPAELARDPYDPDARYRGTVRLTMELLEPDDRILEIFRDNLDDEYAAVRAAAARGLGVHGVAGKKCKGKVRRSKIKGKEKRQKRKKKKKKKLNL
eukprot:TRINITY_DN10893_c1_g1_i1.p4 TRINITY_DN10893_c1_g1~~TRINITY_DN10893_c1_g1_i1.p4  ORF type:complete len:135 (+),score=21.73 TRINITY_DN10893_c1_g1_i1:2-406(+)